MEFDELMKIILKFRRDRKWERGTQTKKHYVLDLVAEVGELVEHFKSSSSKEEAYLKKHKEEVADELADILFWTLILSHDCDINIYKHFKMKMKKNERKYPTNKS